MSRKIILFFTALLAVKCIAQTNFLNGTSPFGSFNNVGHFANLNGQIMGTIVAPIMKPISNAGGPGPNMITLQDVMRPPNNPVKAGSAAAAQGVVAASLLMSSGICFTVAGGLGTAYASLAEAAGVIGQVGARASLRLSYKTAGLDIISAVRGRGLKADAESDFLNTEDPMPSMLAGATDLRNGLSAPGGLREQLQAMRVKIAFANKGLAVVRDAIAQGPKA